MPPFAAPHLSGIQKRFTEGFVSVMCHPDTGDILHLHQDLGKPRGALSRFWSQVLFFSQGKKPVPEERPLKSIQPKNEGVVNFKWSKKAKIVTRRNECMVPRSSEQRVYISILYVPGYFGNVAKLARESGVHTSWSYHQSTKSYK